MDILMMRLNDLACDCKTESGTCFILATGNVCFVKTIPDMWQAFFRNTNAVIADCDEDLALLFGCLDFDGGVC